MKKLWSIVVAIVMALTVCLSLAACGGKTGGGGGGGNNTTDNPNAPAYIGMSVDNIAERNQSTVKNSALKASPMALMSYNQWENDGWQEPQPPQFVSGLQNKDLDPTGYYDLGLKFPMNTNLTHVGNANGTPHKYEFWQPEDSPLNNGNGIRWNRGHTANTRYDSMDYLNIWEKTFNFFKMNGYRVLDDMDNEAMNCDRSRAFGAMTTPTSSKGFYNRTTANMFGMGATLKDLSYYSEIRSSYYAYNETRMFNRNSAEFQATMLQYLAANGFENSGDIALLDDIGVTGTYVDGPNFTLTINLDNPDSYEILSLIVNGKKYQTYQFAETSTSEKIDIKLDNQDFGLHEYTVDAIKYVDGTEIRDVRMLAEQTIDINVVDPTDAHPVEAELMSNSIWSDVVIGGADSFNNPSSRIAKLNEFEIPMKYYYNIDMAQHDQQDQYGVINTSNLSLEDITTKNATLYAVVSDVYKNIIKAVEVEDFFSQFETGNIHNITINFDTPLEESMAYYVSYVIGIDTYDIPPEEATIGDTYKFERKFTTVETECIVTENVSGSSISEKMLFCLNPNSENADPDADAPVLFDSDAIRYDAELGTLSCNVVWNDRIPENYRTVESVKAYLGQTVTVGTGGFSWFDDYYQKRAMYLIDANVTTNNGTYTVNTKTETTFEVEFACVVVEYDNGKKATMFFGLDGKNQIPATVTIESGIDGIDPITLNATQNTTFQNIEQLIDIERFKRDNGLRDEYIFKGIFKDADCTIPVEFPYSVRENGTEALYIDWEDVYQLTYETNGGEDMNPQYSLEENRLNYFRPNRPYKSGAEFGGWYFDAEFTKPVPTDGFTLTEDTTIYAKWITEPVLTFETNGGFPYSYSTTLNHTILENGNLVVPDKAGYTFIGWYYDDAFENQVFVGDRILEDTTIYAKWVYFSLDELRAMPPTAGITVDENGIVSGTTSEASILVLDASVINSFSGVSAADINAVSVLVLKGTVKELGERVFNMFSGLRTVIFESTEAYIGSNEMYANDIFAYVWNGDRFKIYVADESFEMYKTIFETTNAKDKIIAFSQYPADPDAVIEEQ